MDTEPLDGTVDNTLLIAGEADLHHARAKPPAVLVTAGRVAALLTRSAAFRLGWDRPRLAFPDVERGLWSLAVEEDHEDLALTRRGRCDQAFHAEVVGCVADGLAVPLVATSDPVSCEAEVGPGLGGAEVQYSGKTDVV